MLYLVAITAGIFCVAFLSSLPSVWLVGILWFLLLVGYWFAKARGLPSCRIDPARLIVIGLLFVCGLGWGLISAHQTLSSQLPDSYDKHRFLVTGSVVGLVNSDDRRTSFELAVESVKLLDADSTIDENLQFSLNQLLLKWYFKPSDQQLISRSQITSGDHWQLLVQLRKPRGMLNQGGFDYQAWLVQRGYSATGYVVDSDLNKRLEIDKHAFWCSATDAISRFRARIRDAIQRSQLTDLSKSIITALTIGDKSMLGPWWDDLTRFGIVHLLVISGLHIGLVATLGFVLGAVLSRTILLLCSLFSVNFTQFELLRCLSPCLGFLIALIYSLLAGFSLPTQRALIAVAVVMLGKLVYRKMPVYVAFVWALFVIAVAQPLAVISASFWLSFTAVAMLLLWFAPYISRGSSWYRMLGSQLVLFVGLAAPALIYIGKLSWLGLLVNLIAVPWISLVTVPLCLVAGMGYFFFPQLAEFIWLMASWSIAGLWYLLDLLPSDLGMLKLPVPITPVFLFAIALAALGVLLPRGIGLRWLCFVPAILALCAPNQPAPLRLNILDVGQGLGIVLETPNNTLVYDTGPAYSDQFNAGSGVIAPLLRNRGRHVIDKLIVSHGDMDHAGGFYGLIEAVDTKQVLLAPGFYRKHTLATDKLISIETCVEAKRWVWSFINPNDRRREWIYFDVLMPFSNLSTEIPAGNNYSCVLLIRWRDQSILLAGDIERRAERQFLQRYNLSSVTLLVAPHHGSKTSSSNDFVNQLNPSHVVFSAGYRHHFGHPHAVVVDRYKKSGAVLWNTAENGGLTFSWDQHAQLQVLTARKIPPSFWWR
jgi:competence protein ComEC